MTLQVHENKNDPFEKVSPLFLREFYFIISIFMFNPETPEVGKHVPLVLGYQLTLFRPKGADYACYITAPPPIFLDDVASLISICPLIIAVNSMMP